MSETKVRRIKNIEGSRYFFYAILLIVMVFAYKLVLTFLSVGLLAFFSAALVRPIYNIFMSKTNDRHGLSTILTVVFVFFCILIPFAIVVTIVVYQSILFVDFLDDYINNKDEIVKALIDSVTQLINNLPFLKLEFTPEEIQESILNLLRQIPQYLGNFIKTIWSGSISAIGDFVMGLIFFIVFLITFIPNFDRLIQWMKNMSPLDDGIDQIYINKTLAMSKAMILGTFLIALVQGLVSGLALWLAGVPFSGFWTVVMIFLGIIPVVGTWIVTIPIGLILILTGDISGGLIVLTAAAIVSIIDNLMRIKLVPKDAKMHPVLTLIALIGGVKLFGPLGFLFGPTLMIIIVTTFEIYQVHYKKGLEKSIGVEVENK